MTDEEESFKGRRFMIFPVINFDILKFIIFDFSATNVNRDVFILVSILKKLSDGVDWVAVELFDTWSWESHSDDSVSDICEVKIVAKLFESVLRSSYYFP